MSGMGTSAVGALVDSDDGDLAGLAVGAFSTGARRPWALSPPPWISWASTSFEILRLESSCGGSARASLTTLARARGASKRRVAVDRCRARLVLAERGGPEDHLPAKTGYQCIDVV